MLGVPALGSIHAALNNITEKPNMESRKCVCVRRQAVMEEVWWRERQAGMREQHTDSEEEEESAEED